MAHLDAVYGPIFSQAEYQASGSGNGVADLHLPSPMQNAKGYVGRIVIFRLRKQAAGNRPPVTTAPLGVCSKPPNAAVRVKHNRRP